VFSLSARQTPGSEVDNIPQVTFLGTGPGTFEINPDHDFVIKKRSARYFTEPGPTFTTEADNRVWDFSFVPDDEVILYDEWFDFGPVVGPCVVNFVQIDDDVDTRINRFYLNDELVHTVAQGMVTYGTFQLEGSGNLRFFAEDSVGLLVRLCKDTPTTVTPTPTGTATATATATTTSTPTMTPTATITPTETATPSETPTGTLTVTPTASPTMTATPTLTPTVTSTATPTATPTVDFGFTPEPVGTPTMTPGPSPTPTATIKPPRLDSCLRVNFDMGGDEARRGAFVVREVGGAVLAIWEADNGWTDSGWIRDIDIPYPSIYVQVFFHKGDGSDPIEMTILNPAPGTSYGWLTRGKCHAIEVAWPADMTQ
jgi:hypothetical protein